MRTALLARHAREEPRRRHHEHPRVQAWVSDYVGNNKDPHESSNHWHFVTYGRWNPNKRLDGWLRSYHVNKDKPDAPAGECRLLTDTYCDAVAGLHAAECKKRLIPEGFPIPDGLWRWANVVGGTGYATRCTDPLPDEPRG